MKTQGQQGGKDVNSRRTEESNHDFHSPKIETSQLTPDQRFRCLVKRIPQLSFLHLTPEFPRKCLWGEFPGGLVVRIRCFHFHSPDSILGPGTEILQAAKHSQKKKKRVSEGFSFPAYKMGASHAIFLPSQSQVLSDPEGKGQSGQKRCWNSEVRARSVEENRVHFSVSRTVKRGAEDTHSFSLSFIPSFSK